MDFDPQLHWHLQYNHYPPVSYEIFGPICAEAIKRALEEDWDSEIELPDTVEYKGRSTVPVADVIETFHLDDFVREPIDRYGTPEHEAWLIEMERYNA